MRVLFTTTGFPGALAHGLPVVVLPLFGGDPWHTAQRVSELGAVRRVLHEPAFRRAAQRLADEIQALPPVADAPAVLRQLNATAATAG